MLSIGSILSMIAGLKQCHLVTGKLLRLRHCWNPKRAVSSILSQTKRFLIIGVMDPNSGKSRSVGLYLMSHSTSHPVGTRVCGATIVDQSAVAHSAGFITHGGNFLIVFPDILAASIPFQVKLGLAGSRLGGAPGRGDVLR